jgi:hypothetical protein
MTVPHSYYFYPTLTGSKTPTLRLERSKEDKWEITARKDPISLANHQWRWSPPTDGSLALSKLKLPYISLSIPLIEFSRKWAAFKRF